MFLKASVAAVQITSAQRVRDWTYVRGFTTDCSQSVESRELHRQGIDSAEAGNHAGIKMVCRYGKGGGVFRMMVADGTTAGRT